MREAMGIIFANDDYARLSELTFHRATASLPFAARYRLIDFALSNFVNSSVTKVGIITKSNYSSLMDHIRMGRDWDLNRKNSGIAVFPPFANNNSRMVYKGKIEALEGIMDYLERAREEYVILVDGNIVANIDYKAIFKKHIESNAEITLLTYMTKPLKSRRVIINKKENKTNIIKEILVETNHTSDKSKDVEMSLEACILKRELLINMVNSAYSKGFVDFDQIVLQKIVEKYKVVAYPIEGCVNSVYDIKSYFDISMSLLDEKILEDLFYKHGRIFTKVKDSVPVFYGDSSKVKNSLIADGCIIDGTVENSILFRGVTVEEGACIKNSIVMEHTSIGKNSKLNYVIADKDVVIKEKIVMSGHESYPVVIAKGKHI